MKYTEFEKQLRKKLWDSEATIDSDDILGKVLTNKAARKVKWNSRLGLFILLATLGSATLVFIFQAKSPNKQNNLSRLEPLNQFASPHGAESDLKKDLLDFHRLNQTEANKSGSPELAAEMNSKPTKRDAASGLKNNDQIGVQKNMKTKPINHVSINNEASNHAIKKILKSEIIQTGDAQNFSVNIVEVPSVLDAKPPYKLDLSESTGTILDEAVIANNSSSPSHLDERSLSIEPLPIISFNVSEPVLTLPVNQISNHITQPHIQLRRDKFFKFSLLLEGGFLNPIKKTYNPADQQMQEVFKLRDEHEKTLEGIQAGIYSLISIRNSPLYLKTGISYSRLSERMQLSYQYTKIDTSFGITSISKSLTGDTLSVEYGNIYTETFVSGQKLKHHYFQLFDIPLNFGLTLPLGRKWTAAFEAGALFNISMLTQGQILTSPFGFSNIDSESYRMNLGFGYNCSVSTAFAVNQKNDLGLSLRWASSIKTFTASDNPIQQRYRLPGLHLYWINHF